MLSNSTKDIAFERLCALTARGYCAVVCADSNNVIELYHPENPVTAYTSDSPFCYLLLYKNGKLVPSHYCDVLAIESEDDAGFRRFLDSLPPAAKDARLERHLKIEVSPAYRKKLPLPDIRTEIPILRQLVEHWLHNNGQSGTPAIVGPVFEGDYSRIYRVDLPDGSSAAFKICIENGKIDPRFARLQFLEMQDIHLRMCGDTRYRVPECIAFFPSHGAILMNWIDAISLRQNLRRRNFNRQSCETSLFRAGQWLRHFHRSGPAWETALTECDLRREISNARRMLERRDLNLSLAKETLSKLEIAIDSLRGTLHMRSWLHGDFQPGNIMIGKDSVFGIDTAFSKTGAVLADVAHMINDIERTALMPKGSHLLPSLRTLTNAFRDGYLGSASERDLQSLAWFRAIDNVCFLARHYHDTRTRLHRWYFVGMLAHSLSNSLRDLV